ncbi:Solute carrier family 13 member 2 [Lamellibrachia satsuma]|nr:Solute carrier family 13 member 2 [Lamellibrachia satsuma]
MLTVFVLCLTVSIFSEVTSNTTTNTLFLQVLGELAKEMGINPLYIMLPVTICASCAFMLPVATPPNAIVFSYGENLRIIDMDSEKGYYGSPHYIALTDVKA